MSLNVDFDGDNLHIFFDTVDQNGIIRDPAGDPDVVVYEEQDSSQKVDLDVGLFDDSDTKGLHYAQIKVTSDSTENHNGFKNEDPYILAIYIRYTSNGDEITETALVKNPNR